MASANDEHHPYGRHLQGGGVDVIGRLGKVDMVQRVYEMILPLLAAEEFYGPVGQHLVHVHVEGCAGPSLKGIGDELVCQLPLNDFRGCLDDCLTSFACEQIGADIGPGTCLLDLGQRTDQLFRHV